MPDPDPRSWEKERLVLGVLLEIEAARLHAHEPKSAPALLLIDRSVWTLVGHCAGTDHRDRRDPGFAERAVGVLAADSRPRWPQAILYLDVSHEVQTARNRTGKFAPDSVFVDRDYNRGFRSYFAQLRARGELPIAWIDGVADVDTVLEDALRFLADDVGLHLSG
jgi:thymidylate kinase